MEEDVCKVGFTSATWQLLYHIYAVDHHPVSPLANNHTNADWLRFDVQQNHWCNHWSRRVQNGMYQSNHGRWLHDAISMLWKWCMSCCYAITGFSLTTVTHIMLCCYTVSALFFQGSAARCCHCGVLSKLQPCSWKDIAHSPFSTCGLKLQMSQTKLSANQHADQTIIALGLVTCFANWRRSTPSLEVNVLSKGYMNVCCGISFFFICFVDKVYTIHLKCS